ncbi:MAG: hypothetical protein RMJ56_17655 [Gemmataceae bacterium]|nr:hypothetical protein [Gemmata sp.]MDW8199424.1 hypothetical protein [Gemmataceae bacterium]
MSFRLGIILASSGLALLAPAVSAQPQVPTRPRYTQFQSVFAPGRPLLVNPGQGLIGLNQPRVALPAGPQVPGFIYPGMSPEGLPAPVAVNPAIAPTGVAATFNNLGHWYAGQFGSYGHWYPNGIRSGAGVLGSSGGGVVGGVGVGGGLVGPGMMGVGGPRTGVGSVLGTGLMAGATINQFRR